MLRDLTDERIEEICKLIEEYQKDLETERKQERKECLSSEFLRGVYSLDEQICDEDLGYTYGEQTYCEQLNDFYGVVNELAEEQQINTRYEEDEYGFYHHILYFKLKDKYFRFECMQGQGSILFLEPCNKSMRGYKYVKMPDNF